MVVGRDEVAEVVRWAEGIERVHECIAGRFRRPEPRRRALTYLRGLLSPVERKNGWQLAEQAGDATPDGVQRLLYNYRWEADLVRDDLRDYVVEHLGEADGVVTVDDVLGFVKKGDKSVGVPVTSTAGRRGGSKTARKGSCPGLCQRQRQDADGLGRSTCQPGTFRSTRNVGLSHRHRRIVCFRTNPHLAHLLLRNAL